MSSSHPLRNGLAILELLGSSARALGVTEIARELAMAKSSVHDLLKILVEMGHVECRDSRLGYTVTAGVVRAFGKFSEHFVRGGDLSELLRETSMKLEGSIYVARLIGRKTVVVGGHFRNASSATLGCGAPVYRSSVGKVLVAQLPRDQWEHYAPSEEVEAKGYSPEKFFADVECALREGVGWNLGELWSEECSVAAAIPRLSGSPMTAAALVFAKERFQQFAREDLVKKLTTLVRGMAEICPQL